MILGVGVDLVEINRIARVCVRQPRFPERILTPAEREYCLHRRGNPMQHVAGRWCAKEAIAKAVGRPLRWQEVEILPDAQGKPVVHLHGASAQVVGVGELLVSITHTRTLAQAIALWVVNR
ncbi:MAG: holo-[acyl-carrier-protein] synthase [Fimbriimonadales bacterium]|nr:MAG: holo-[acyl-carrier-protein] synthase [Fimbriimonadales bacterium]GIV09805.1 MAG: holo-[acyl-carrier-protein] synthase [Fimbriimonadales bacterium]